MGMTRAMAKEAMRALLVLALVVFNFAHAPASAAVGYDSELQPYFLPTTAIVVDCGYPQNDDAANAPCHACRIGGAADLPPSPDSCLSVTHAAGTVAYPVGTHRPTSAIPPHSGEPRAPPAV